MLALIARGVREKVPGEHTGRVTREAIARRLAVPQHQVEQVLARLVREGLLAKEPDSGAHETTRSRLFRGADTGWAPTYWRLRDLPRWRALGAQSA